MAENFESENNETDEDFDENRSVFRYFKNLKQIFEKYSDVNQVSDVVDMETLEVITDNGDIADIQEPTHFGYSALAITKKDSAGRFDEREYEEFLRDPDSFINPPNLPADPLRVKTEFPEAFNKTYVVNTLNQHSARLPNGVEEDALCRLEETHIEIIDSTSSEDSSDYLSDESSSSSSSSGDDLFLYKDKPSSGDPRNNPSNRNVVRSGKSTGHWNALIRSPWKVKDKGSQSHGQKSPGIFKNKRFVNAKIRNGRKPGRIPADHRQCEKRLTLTPNIPDKFEFENHFECDDEKENLLGKEFRGGQHSYSMSTTESSHGDSSDTQDLNIKPRNPFHAAERQFQQRPTDLKHPLIPAAVNAVEKRKRRITPSLVRPLSNHHTPLIVGPKSTRDCFVINPESPSVSMTKSLKCLTLDNHNNIHQPSDKPLDLSKNTSSWNSQNPHTAYSEKSKPRVEWKKVLEPKRLKERFTGCYLAPRTVEERMLILDEGSSEGMEDLSNNSSSDDDEASSAQSPLALAPSETPNEVVKKSIDDHPFLKPMITEMLVDRPPMAKLARTVIPGSRDTERGASQPCVKVGASPHGRPHVQPSTIQRSPFTSPVAFFKVMQRKNKESPIACQKVLKPTAAQTVLYSSSNNSNDAKQVVRNDYRESTKQSIVRADIQGSPAAYQKKHKSITTAQKMYSSGDSGSEAKQSLGRNDLQESPAAYQKLEPGTGAQKMLYLSGDSGSVAKQSRGIRDYRASPKHSIDRTALQGSPAECQMKLKPNTVAEKMLYSSGDNCSDAIQSTGRNEYRASTKQLIARAEIQGSPAAHQKKPKPRTVAQKMLYSSGDSGGEAKQLLGRNDLQESPTAYQKKLKPGTGAQKMYSSGDSGSEAKQSLGRRDYRASPKHSIARADLQGSPAAHQKKPKPRTVAQKMLYSSGDSGGEAKQLLGRNDLQESPIAYQKKLKPGTGAQKMYSSGDSGSEAKQSLGRRDYRASPKHSIARADLQGSPAAYQKKAKPNTVAQKMLYSSGDSGGEAKQSRDINNYQECPKHSLVTELPESTPILCFSPRNEVTPPHADPQVVQATKTATTSTPTKGHNLAMMALDISCIPKNVPPITEGKSSHRVTSRGDNGQRGDHTTKQGQGCTVLASFENVPENSCSVRQKYVLVKTDGEGSIGHRLSSPTVIEVPGFRIVEPMEDSSTSKLGTDDTMEHDLRSTSDSDSDNETFTVLSPQPKISSQSFRSIHQPQVRREKKTLTNAPRQSYLSPLQRQVREKAAQREHQKMASSAPRASPAGGKQRSYTPKRRNYDSDSDSDHSCHDTACASGNIPKSERSVNDRLFDSRNPTKHTLSEPRRFFPNKKLTPSPCRFKEKSKSVVKNPRASKQLYSTTTSKVATPSPSAQKNLSQKSQADWNWSFNKKQIDPYAKQLDVYELDSESCDSDIDAPINRRHKVVPVQRKSKTGTKPMAILSPRVVDSKASGGKARLSRHKNVSRIFDSSSDEQSDDTRPLLNSRYESGMTNSSLCLGPGKCDKTFCFTCV